MSRAARRMRLLAVAATGVAISLLATIAIDRILGALARDSTREASLIFPPHVRAIYETTEFTSTASSNALGFRDREFALTAARCRGLAIGDSFTFGWGVEIEESWPKVLEATSNAAGLDLEIANLGRPGAGPVDYVAVADRSIPLLRPDFVLIGVLQGDDLSQSEAVTLPSRGSELKRRLNLTMLQIYPHVMRAIERLRRPPPASPLNIQTEWQRQADEILQGLTTPERERYEHLDEALRTSFAAGKLNPWLVQMALRDPAYFLNTFDPTSRRVQRLVEQMAVAFEHIKQVGDRYGTQTIILAVPFGIYVNRGVFETRRAMGFELDDRMLVADVPDREIGLAAERAGLPFISVTDQFRVRQEEQLFFPLDNHLNAAGHRLYADLIAHRLPAILRDTAPRCQIK